jgi:hypothetical protein
METRLLLAVQTVNWEWVASGGYSGSLYIQLPNSNNVEDAVTLTVYNTNAGTFNLTLQNGVFGPIPTGNTDSMFTESIGGESLSYYNNSKIMELSIGGPLNSPSVDAGDTMDTVVLGNAGQGITISGNLSVNAGSVSFSPGIQINTTNTTLNTVSSLNWPLLGVSYQGNATVNAAPVAPQPFAGFYSFTGPDWESFGYRANQSIIYSIDNAAN